MGTTKEVVGEYCVRKLAQILHDCVDCPGDRAEIDWAMAKEFVDKNCNRVVEILTEELIGVVVSEQVKNCKLGDQITLIIECNYERFDQLFGRFVWDNCYQRIKHRLPHPPYGRINFE